ncbi:MAG TPA: site-specific integrase [Planctomycetota bacterium]|jgi:integrase
MKKNSRTVSAYQVPGRLTWALTWTHPKTGKRTTRNLATREATEAKGTALDLERLVNSPTLWDLEPEDENLEGFDPKAIEVFYGRTPQPKTSGRKVTIELNTTPLRAMYSASQGLKPRRNLFVATPELDEALRHIADKDREIALQRRTIDDVEAENREYRRKLNLHVNVTLADAATEFKKHYQGRDKRTTQQVLGVVDNFSHRMFGGKTHGHRRLGEIVASHINNWLVGYRRKRDETEISQTTRAKLRRYLSSFWSWAFRHYDLSENPMAKAQAVAGVAPEHIVAIRRHEDLRDLLNGLKPWPYWRAWVAVAVLAGPRFSEQVHLKVSDVVIESAYIRIATRASGRTKKGTKTGRERNVPIERTLLLPILKKHLKTLKSDSLWLFPTLVSGHGCKNDGLWRNQIFAKHWFGQKARKNGEKEVIGIAEQAKQNAESNGEFWDFGPREWRHCAGTAMGHTGMSALQISQWLGNSEDICRRHYIAPIGAKPWPLRYC